MAAFLMPVKPSTELAITLCLISLRRGVYPLSYCDFFGRGTRINLALLTGTCESDPFGVKKNGVRQGGVLSPILFTDELLQHLSSFDIGCHVGHHYIGSVCYAIALLAPSPSVLRILLRECELFVTEHNLMFNAAEAQLICFRPSSKVKFIGKFFFSGHLLEFSDSVTQLVNTGSSIALSNHQLIQTNLTICDCTLIITTIYTGLCCICVVT